MMVAVVSKDGIHVDDHFGQAQRFLIYEISGQAQHLLKISTAAPLSEGDPGHVFNQEKFAAVLAALAGCRRVYCTKIGDKPAAALRQNNIEPLLFDGPIANISID